MQIAISAVISTVISLVILNFGEDIWDWARDTVDDIAEWLSEKKSGDKWTHYTDDDGDYDGGEDILDIEPLSWLNFRSAFSCQSQNASVGDGASTNRLVNTGDNCETVAWQHAPDYLRDIGAILEMVFEVCKWYSSFGVDVAEDF